MSTETDPFGDGARALVVRAGPGDVTFERVGPDGGANLHWPDRLLSFGTARPADGAILGEYERLSQKRTRLRTPDQASSLLVVMVDNTDTEHEDEFNAWYDEVHVGDILDPGTYYRATRWRRVGADAAQPGYLTVYESDDPDPLAAHAPVTERSPSMVIWPSLRVRQLADYRRTDG